MEQSWRQDIKWLLGVLWLAGVLRVIGINWDRGFLLHPDERMILMVVHKLSPTNFNPKFFAYGSFPLYLLRISAWVAGIKSLVGMAYLGRVISIMADLMVAVLLYFLGQLFFGKRVGLASAFLWATCVFPIQLSHFYAVDIMLNCFIWATLYFLVRFWRQPKKIWMLLAGVFLGLSLATKLVAGFLLIPIVLSLGWGLAYKRRKWEWGLYFAQLWTVAILVFVLTEPYALLDFSTFWRQIREQSSMAKNPWIFPYTLQYVNTPPYWYHCQNLFLWGLGIGLSILVLGGFWFYKNRLRAKKIKKGEWILLSFSLSYFLIVGQFAVKFMRYFLPLYPFCILLASWFLVKARNRVKWLALGVHLVWCFAFLTIFLRPHTRIQASWWIHQHIPPGAVLAVEHWDDRLPLWGEKRYQFVVLPMYDDDFSPIKWTTVESALNKANFLIIASNRLWRPLMRLADCRKFLRCYPKTASYYRDLFAGRLGFVKVAEFTSFPLGISDEGADESFTVYDHPRVMIFAKIKKLK